MSRIITVFVYCIILTSLSFSQSQQEEAITKEKAFHSESYKSLTFDGAWCWFSDPRAIYYEGEYKRTYSGWVDSYGDIIVGFYDHETQQIQTTVLEDNYQKDDHDNPALLFTPNGKLMVFFTKHSSPNPTLFFVMENVEDISLWEKRELFLNDMEEYEGYKNTNTYVNPVMLTEENNRIYLFWRGVDNKPNYSFSDDMGINWSKGRIFLQPENVYELRRPYMKVASNGKDKIAFAFTDGHPRNEEENSIYYMYYKDGNLHGIDDKIIAKLGELPVEPSKASMVYNASIAGAKAWIWDVALDDDDRPVLVYSKFPDDQNHIYSYSKWNGEKWTSSNLTNSGSWFPQTKVGKIEPEPNYSGGISLDHENPNIVYLSAKRDSVFEIEKWETSNGVDWKATAITNGSSKDNVRPFAVRNASDDNSMHLLWIQNTKYIHYTDYLSSIKMSITSSIQTDVFDKENIKNLMRQTADWQLANPFSKVSRLEWHWGTFYIGLEALYESTKENRYLNEMINLGQSFAWKLIDDIYHADRIAIADAYAWLYGIKKDPLMIDKTKWSMDIHIARKPKADVSFMGNDYKLEWWSWCDALFMAPPSFARMYKVTDEIKYLDYADKHWWITSDYLYSPNDSLYFRDDRFFDKKSANGEKIFWARGNGWVVAGLARMLQIIPESYLTRSKYIQQFQEMAEKLLLLQREHGLWTASLYDPDELPIGESSGSAFFTYALTWGVNNGILDKVKYSPAIKKAWKALTNNVNEWGRLGYVQQVAGDPYPFFEYEWQVYATGAFLLCGKEMIEFLDN